MILTGNIRVEIISAPEIEELSGSIRVIVAPSATSTASSPSILSYGLRFDIIPLEIDFGSAFINSSNNFLNDILDYYIDEERELKTVLNFGKDKQSLILNRRYGNLDSSFTNTLQLKLLKEVPSDVSLGSRVFVSRELSNSIIDKTRIRYAPRNDYTPYLRPRNESVKVEQTGNKLNDVTLRVLSIQTGSIGAFSDVNRTFEDGIFRQWYSYDFDSSELNIDFTDYSNFVFYGSAAMRLAGFREKLKKIEKLDTQIAQFSGSVWTGQLAESYSALGGAALLEFADKSAVEKETLIRSFDRYEQHLYFTLSGSYSPYSASFDYVDGGIEYNNTSYWPKNSSGNLYDVTSTEAINWYESQLQIAQRFDEFNENNLINTIPSYLREDDDSQSYVTFVTMIGHFFDLIKPYIDQMPYIYDRYINPDEGLSKDLVDIIIDSVGFKLPSLNSLDPLYNYISPESYSDDARRNFSIETKKRLLHNLPLFAKTKGTRYALSTLLKTFGINDQFLTVSEEGIPETSSIYVYNEFSNGIDFDTSSTRYISIPLNDSSLNPYPRSLQFNLSIANSSDATILNGDEMWKLDVTTHPTISSLGRFELISGSTTILSSSYEPIFDDELINITLRTYSTGSYANLFIAKVDEDDIIFSSSLSEPISADQFVPMWNITDRVYLGGSGSYVTERFDGTIDEVRLWGINNSDQITLDSAFDAGTNAGGSYTDASDYLYVKLSFNKVDSSVLPSQLLNESPYKDKSIKAIEYIPSHNVTTDNFSRYNRTVKQVIMPVGQSIPVTRKVKISDAPVFENNSVDVNGSYVLSNDRSIVSPKTKRNKQFNTNKVKVVISPTQTINTNIIRNISYENINTMLGVPRDFYVSSNTSLERLKTHYRQYYYADVNFNRVIRIASAAVSVLNQTVDYFVPSRSNLLYGISIEQNVLEKVYITRLKNLRFYGGSSRKTINAPASLTGSKSDYEATFNLSQTIALPTLMQTTGSYNTYTSSLDLQNSDISGSYNTYTSTLNVQNSEITGSYNTYTSSIDAQNSEISGSYNTHTSLIDFTEEFVVSGSYNTHTSSIKSFDEITNIAGTYNSYDLQHLDWYEHSLVSQSLIPAKKQAIKSNVSQVNKIPFNNSNLGKEGAEPYGRVYPRKLFEYEINYTSRPTSKGTYNDALYPIKPNTNFNVFSVTNYYNHPEGVYFFPETYLTPIFSQPTNAVWDFEQQEFLSGVTTWSYGDRYDYMDVVYQEVNKYSSFATDLGELTGSARHGNGRYYVFTQRTQVSSLADGSPGYVSGSGIPSYIPPSLDQTKWKLLRFRPIQKRTPYRIVYDTTVFTDPKENDYKTITIDLSRIIDSHVRYITTFSTTNITAEGSVSGEISLQNISALFAIQASNSNLRLRLYRTDEGRISDVDRSITTDPDPSAGVLLDTTIDSTSVQLINPVTFLVAGSLPPGGRIFYTVDNLNSFAIGGVNISLLYLAIEIQNRVPVGYLRSHYRFFRDNSTATKRRNWLGCKNTIETTADKLPPVQVFIKEGAQLSVSQTLQNKEIITGGGGTLQA